jgi:hypothetical protein
VIQQVTATVVLTVEYAEGLSWETAKALVQRVLLPVADGDVDVEVRRVTRLEWVEED